MREVLSNPAVRRLLAASAVSQVGDWAARLAVAFLVLDETGLASGVSVVGALFVLPWLGPGQYLASWGDRLPRIPLLVACEGTRALLFGLIAFASSSAPVWVLLAGVAIVATIDPVWEANRAALLVDVTTSKEYGPAQKFSQTISQTATLAGWGLGGLLVGWIGTAGTLWLNSLTFAVSAALVAGIVAPEMTDRIRRSGSLTAAVAYLRGDRLSGIALATTVGFTVTGMAIETQAPVFGRVIGLEDGWIGVLAAMVPAVTLVGVLAIPDRMDDAPLVAGGFAFAAAGGAAAFVAFLFPEILPLAFVAYGSIGVAFAASTAANIVVGRRLPKNDRATVFAVIQTAVFISLSLGALVGGPISDLTSPVAAARSMALATSCICLVGAFLALRSRDSAESGDAMGKFPKSVPDT